MFTPDMNARILDAALASPDAEICGFVLDNDVIFCDNVAQDPTTKFLIAEVPEDAQAIFHSHPGGPFYPSEHDMRQQEATAKPWGIACTSGHHSEVFWFGDDAPKAPIIGRPFRHGVSDCYELIRDFYKEVHGISLMNVPRDWEWWHKGGDLYSLGFEKAGFHEVSLEEVLPGDVFLASVASDKTNHGGIYLGNGLILHHTTAKDGFDPYRLSCVEPAARWMKFFTKVLRHEDDQIDRKAGQGIWP